MTNIEKAKALIGTFSSGDLKLADSLLAPRYIQHNLAFADGKDAFIAAVAGLQQAPVKTTVKVMNACIAQDVTLSSETYSAPCPGGCLDGGAG